MPERRWSVRYTASLEVWAQELSAGGIPDASAAVIRGTTRNVSDGGLCVAWDRRPGPSSLLRCRILVAGSSAAIPTLAQVRWVHQDEGEPAALAGMAFLLQ